MDRQIGEFVEKEVDRAIRAITEQITKNANVQNSNDSMLILKDQEIADLKNALEQAQRRNLELQEQLKLANASLEMAKGNADGLTNENAVLFGDTPVTNADIVMDAAMNENAERNVEDISNSFPRL